jgi:hypothetical protein
MKSEEWKFNMADENKAVLNWYFQFHHPSMYTLFMTFHHETKLSYFFIFVLLFFVSVLFPAAGASMLATMADRNVQFSLSDRLFVFANFFVVSFMMIVSLGIGFHRSELVRWILTPAVSCILYFYEYILKFCYSMFSKPYPSNSQSTVIGFCTRVFHYSPFSDYYTTVLPITTPTSPLIVNTPSPPTVSVRRCTCSFLSLSELWRDPLALLNPMLVVLVQLFYAMLVLQFTLHVKDIENPKHTLFETHYAGLIPIPAPASVYPNTFVIMHSIFLFFIPSFFFASMPDLSITAVWNILVLTTCLVVAVAIKLRAHDCFVILAILLISSSMLIVDLQIHKVRMFLTALQLRDSLAENERNAAAKHVEELRHMIGNVAHDLKTVSNKIVIIWHLAEI